MAIVTGKDRRGLAEIVAIATVAMALGGVVVVQLIVTHHVSNELLVILGAVGGALPIRGVQSAMERGASSEHRNAEAAELRAATERLDRAANELQRVSSELMRERLEEQNRALMLAAASKEKG